MPLNEFLDFWFELPLFQSLKKLSEGKLNQIKIHCKDIATRLERSKSRITFVLSFGNKGFKVS